MSDEKQLFDRVRDWIAARIAAALVSPYISPADKAFLEDIIADGGDGYTSERGDRMMDIVKAVEAAGRH